MNVEKTKKIRVAHKAFVYKTMENAEKMLTDGGEDLSSFKEKLTALKSLLTEKVETIRKLDETILESIKPKELDKEIEDSGEFGQHVYSILAKINFRLEHSEHSKHGGHMQAPAAIQGNANYKNAESAKVKLPKLELKSFSGNYQEWQSFWDTFQSAVDGNTSISPIEKFTYLKSCVTSNAESAIAGLTLTADNYKVAVDILKDRFGKPQLLISNYMDALLKLPSVNSVHETKKLRELYDKIEINIRGLNALGVESQSFGNLLVPIVMEKIPSELRLIVSRKFGSEGTWNLDAFLNVLKTELEARERCTAMKTSGPSNNTSKFEQYKTRSKQPYSASALYTGSEESNSHCVFCKKNHKSINCLTVTEPKTRRTILRRNGRCFVCLKSGHISVNCQSRAKCFNCEGRHHVTICERTRNTVTSRNLVSEGATPHGSEPPQDRSGDTGASTMHISNNVNSVLLQTAQAFVCRPDNPEIGLNAHMIFDSCSQRSYITSTAREQLNLPTVGKETLLIKTFGDDSASIKECDVVQLCVRTLDGLNVYVTSYVVPVICSPVSNQQTQDTLKCYPYLQGLQFACGTSDTVSVDVLIGADYYWYFFTGNIIKRDPSGPVALETKLGWVLSGPAVCPTSTRSCTVNLSSTHVLKIESTEISDMKDDLQKFWDLETLGIKEREASVYDKFSSDIRFTGERYQVKLPFKDSHPMLPDNYTAASRRLTTTIKKLKDQPEILKQYDHVIREQLQSGVVELPQDQIPQPGSVHYLPHRAVVRLDRDTTKVRVVYDASSKMFGPSLNDCLHVGPSLNPYLFDILLRFRVHDIALTADVEKAFLNIEIEPEHRDFLRFLWVDDLDKESPELMVMRFARVVFGVNSSPFILNATIRHHLNTCLPVDSPLTRELLKSLYVDDYVSGDGDVGSAFILSKKIKLCLKSGGFNMRKWNSNSEELLKALQEDETFHEDFDKSDGDGVEEEDESFSKSVFKQSTEKEQKVLGMLWNPTQDELIYDLNKTLGDVDAQPATRRLVLSTATRFFDPLGLIAPIILPFKIMFQKLCKAGRDWDELLDTELHHQWQTTLLDLRQAGRISFKRCYAEGLNGDKAVQSVQLHCFADASERAYGAAVYMRVEYESRVECQIISSKTRVAPLAKQTIPRLELLSNLAASRLLKSVSQALEAVRIDNVFNWTDSMISLWWITNTNKEYKQFVENRVAEIRRNSPPQQWRYCPTAQNPADIASRGIKATELKESSLWLHGPEFLFKSSEHWPKQPANVEVREELCELKSSVSSLATTCVEDREEEASLANVIKPEKFSSVTKLITVTALVLLFVEKLKKVKSREEMEEASLRLYRQAEKLWIKYVQKEILKSDKYPQMKSSLGLYQDEEGMLRCQGRIGLSSLPHDTRFPILLPRGHHFTKLVILNCHDQVMHNGVAETLVQVRSKYWIAKGRQTVKSIISKCVVCKKLEGRPYGMPPTPQLPGFRLSDEFAFTSIGVDFAGPVYVKDIYDKSSNMNKAYIVLYTCASSRAVHLDLIPRLTTEAFVRSFKRFIARRGVPNLVVSDNGSTFKSEELKKLLAEHNIDWKFNVALAPWWGGFFERLVRSTKRCLKKTLGTARVSFEELLSVVVEIEGILNSRPLTYVDDELRNPLTPSQLIIGRRLLSSERKTGGPPSTAPQTGSELSKRAKYLTTVLSQFWRRWQKEYLTELRVHHNCQSKNRQPTVEIGDVVCIHKDKTPRQFWNMGVVKSLITGRDGFHRGAVVRTRSGDRVIEVTRPLKKLYPVEAGLRVPERQNRNTDFPITFVGNAEQEHVAEH